MRSIAIVGLVLIALGMVSFTYPGVTYTVRETIVDIGGLNATADRQKTLPVPPALGLLAMASGAALLIADARKHSVPRRS